MLGLGFITLPNTPSISSIPTTNPIPNHQSLLQSIKPHTLPYPKPHTKNPRRFRASFSEDKEQLSEKPNGNGGGANGEDDKDDLKTNKERNGGVDEPPRFNLRWSELLFDPDPDNVLAVGLTGVLAWASVQVLWQLFVISFAILAAAVKYSFIAALLIFILITLL